MNPIAIFWCIAWFSTGYALGGLRYAFAGLAIAAWISTLLGVMGAAKG